MRYTGPKNRLARREGADLGLKTPGTKSHASLLKKINILPGQHGVRARRKYSERGRQLREKQKLRYIFGITEKQLKKYFYQARKKRGNTALLLAQFLEKRLDNIVYRLALAPTRASARQLVNHNKLNVDGRRVNIPSFQVKIGEAIDFANEKTAKIPYIENILANKSIIIPKWLEKQNNCGKLISEPNAEEIEKQVNLREVIEYYSR